MRPYLIYTSAGERSNVHKWVSTEDRSYDLWITNYSDSPGLLKEYADFYDERKGAKFPNFMATLTAHGDTIRRYRAIMVADDDIIISPKKLDRLFSQLEKQNLWIIAPAYSRFGKITHDTTERRIATRYRHTNFAEVTCPIFRTDKLMEFMSVYDGTVHSYGVDWWYLHVLGEGAKDKIVISDENYCINPLDLHKSSSVREIDRCMSAEMRKASWETVKERFGMQSFKKEIYHGERRGWLSRLLAWPVYATECVFDVFMSSRALNPLKRLCKRAIRKAKRVV